MERIIQASKPRFEVTNQPSPEILQTYSCKLALHFQLLRDKCRLLLKPKYQDSLENHDYCLPELTFGHKWPKLTRIQN